jgi:predicted molibdopterin-dependent oxidoreductase YjgC
VTGPGPAGRGDPAGSSAAAGHDRGGLGGSPPRAGTVSFRFDGRAMTAPAGSTIAAALLGNGVLAWRTTRRRGEPRGLFCGIGYCHDCLVDVNGRPAVRACQEPVGDGDDVRPSRSRGWPDAG